MKRFGVQLIGTLFVAQLLACSGAANDASETTNKAPSADAGIDQTIEELTQAVLPGSGSDSDGSVASYLWAQNSGTSVTLLNANSAVATFTAPAMAGDDLLAFELTVTDNKGASSSDSVIVTITGTTPTADAGSFQFVTSSDYPVTLDASGSTDNQVESLSYAWLRTDSTGVAIDLSNVNVAQPTFTAPMLTAAITVGFEVTVTDNGGLSDSASVNIAIQPVINEQMNDTGMMLCGDYAYTPVLDIEYDNNNVDCADATDAIGNNPIPDGQDADYGRDKTANDDADGKAGFSFTKLDNNGAPLLNQSQDYATNPWPCVRDNVTGLIWEVKTTDGGLRDKYNIYTWYIPSAAINGGNAGLQNGGTCIGSDCDTLDYANEVNTQGLCGFDTGWRMPNIEELRSIVDYSIPKPGPTIDIDYFPNTQTKFLVTGFGAWYWTSTPYAYQDFAAWNLFFSNGRGTTQRGKTAPAYVRLVHPGQ